MVSISLESREQTDARLRAVIGGARLRVFDGAWCFAEFAADAFPAAVRDTALAVIRDGDGWSQLVPFAGGDAEAFGLFSFHFAPGLDNSGFVGWLATLLKERFGTGVFVICGYNGRDGGVFDYWGCPVALADAIVAEVRALAEGGA